MILTMDTYKNLFFFERFVSGSTMTQNQDPKNQNPWRALAVVSVIGVNAAIFLLVGLWIGKKVDLYLHTSPVFLIIGMIVGIIFGIWSVIGLIKPFLGD